MKLLLDENVPRPLAVAFPGSFEVHTVQRMGWAGAKNGDLLRLAADGGFHALVTVDRGFEHQQNRSALPVPVIVLVAVSNRPRDLKPLVPGAVAVLAGDLKKSVYRVPA